jgi:hypothetical protein
MGTMEAFTRENREAIYRPVNRRVTYHPVDREVDLAVSLAPGGVASERVGGATSALAPAAVEITARRPILAA